MPGGDGSDLLAAGEAFADLSGWRKVGVSGADALDWLDALLTADLGDLAPGRARRALLLSPTGRVRADVTVTVPGGNLVLVQDPDQPPIEDLLAPYVLSSDVALRDRTGDLSLFAFPGRAEAPDAPGVAHSAPSCLGRGADLFAPAEDHDRLLASLERTFRRADPAEVEAWRVASGIPRFGVDGTEDDLPQEAGLDAAVDLSKGCFLGQEAVARVRNLGHPRRVVVPFEAPGSVRPGEALLADGDRVGLVTSAAPAGARWRGLARVRWDVRDPGLRTGSGVPVTPDPISRAATP